jgi:hypothetical protein
MPHNHPNSERVKDGLRDSTPAGFPAPSKAQNPVMVLENACIMTVINKIHRMPRFACYSERARALKSM